ncbi:MAG: thimet oligopeptidase [bacterium]|nr:MAG: thimet oligopeptidase [bacterium]
MTAVDLSKADPATKFMMEESLRNFRRAGVDKDEATRTRITTINEELVKIGQEFDRNIREDKLSISLDSVDQLDGLPADYIAAHKPDESGKITITTDYPDYFPVITYAKDGAVRQKLYQEFMKRGNPKNLETLNNLINKRHELATTLGYANWADFMTEDKMIGSTENAQAFIDKITTAATPRSQQEYQEMLGVKKRFDETATEVADYDKFYLAEILKREKYNFDSQAARVYFDFPIVRDGILNLVSTLWGVEFRKVTGAPTWHPEVEVYDVYEGPTLRGRIYLDLHPRDGKYGHAAQFTMRNGVKDIQSPIGALVCNLQRVRDLPARIRAPDAPRVRRQPALDRPGRRFDRVGFRGGPLAVPRGVGHQSGNAAGAGEALRNRPADPDRDDQPPARRPRLRRVRQGTAGPPPDVLRGPVAEPLQP